MFGGNFDLVTLVRVFAFDGQLRRPVLSDPDVDISNRLFVVHPSPLPIRAHARDPGEQSRIETIDHCGVGCTGIGFGHGPSRPRTFTQRSYKFRCRDKIGPIQSGPAHKQRLDEHRSAVPSMRFKHKIFGIHP